MCEVVAALLELTCITLMGLVFWVVLAASVVDSGVLCMFELSVEVR